MKKTTMAQAIGLALGLTVLSSHAATITVDTNSDTASGMCRLRDAIISANTDAVVEGCAAGTGNDNIDLQQISGSTITLAAMALPTISSTISIEGNGATVDGDNQSRLFNVDTSGILNIDNLTMTKGDGGAIMTYGTTRLTDSRLTENNAFYGGAIYGYQATVSLTNSILSGNYANKGGAIFALETSVNVTNSELTGNSAAAHGAISIKAATINLTNSTLIGNATIFGNGGAIYGDQAEINLISSTIATNSAVNGHGGAISSKEGTVNLLNSTLSGNTATKKGGAIYAKAGTSNLTSSTLHDNTAQYGNAFYNLSGTLELTNSILSSPSAGADCYQQGGTFTTNGVNLVQKKGGCGIPTGVELIEDTDPMLNSLADNGGPTLTLLPLTGSQVIDAGDDSVDPPLSLYDQRGTPFNRVSGAKVDLGAVELQIVSPEIFEDGFEG